MDALVVATKTLTSRDRHGTNFTVQTFYLLSLSTPGVRQPPEDLGRFSRTVLHDLPRLSQY